MSLRSIRRGLRRRPAAERAQGFAQLTSHRGVQQWMLWQGWCLHVGCDVCADHGTAAGCWGHAGCHSYAAGCGCLECATRQIRDVAVLERSPAATEAGRAGRAGR